ncbi:hypothetical protein HT102_01580 [Hoyosella sp. G463]|uniref:Uncharacterized protein n=1 Tax=Lolliginicoccus lacisalsi TaxID=2742202 RepID=A0A927J9I8_9ACTN|nr:hypothetical protein [Lolliginicoccus lacisalsi]MBD8505181.1 hypothetical protein [Lolliginicoccus lacisalsi]
MRNDDVSAAAIAGLGTRGAIGVVTAWVVVGTSGAVIANHTWLGAIGALVIGPATLALAILAVSGRSEPIRARRAWLVVGLAMIVAIAEGWVIEMQPSQPRWAWVVIAAMMAVLALRGRTATAITGHVMVSATHALMPVAAGPGWQDSIVPKLIWTSCLFAIGLGCALMLRAQSRRATTLRAAGESLLVERAAVAARERESAALVTELRQSAIPGLERIAGGGPLDARERSELLLIEAGLRDRMRARVLATERVLDAATRARRRGIDVVLLDDGGLSGARSETKDAVDALVARVLDEQGNGTVTVRVVPPGREHACSIVASSPDGARRVTVRQGTPIQIDEESEGPACH